MMLNNVSSAISLLETRRSGRPRDLVAPGPSEAELARMLAIAARTPDHGRLVPYRFVVVGPGHRQALAELYRRALRDNDPTAPDAKIEKSAANAHAAPVLVILISSPIADHKIPLWEQRLCCGAVGMNLLHAGHALGYVGGWITGWPAYDPTVAGAFCREGEQIAGFIYFGTSTTPIEERDRPDLDSIVEHWPPAG